MNEWIFHYIDVTIALVVVLIFWFVRFWRGSSCVTLRALYPVGAVQCLVRAHSCSSPARWSGELGCRYRSYQDMHLLRRRWTQREDEGTFTFVGIVSHYLTVYTLYCRLTITNTLFTFVRQSILLGVKLAISHHLAKSCFGDRRPRTGGYHGESW